MQRGICAQVDPDQWFPEKGDSPRQAKAICRNCSVSIECLQYALEHPAIEGIWGGTTFKERQQIRRQMPAALVQHGTRRSYLKGCRCEPCGDAERTYQKVWRARKKAS